MNRYARWILIAVVIAGALIAGYVIFARQHPALAPNAVSTTTPTHIVIGTSVQGRPIDAYLYGTGATHLLFVGGMHGGYEWNAALLAYQYKQYLDAHPEAVPAGITIAVIPELNVDGVARVVGKAGPFTETDVNPSESVQVSGRTNTNEVDLNRNFDCNWQAKATWRREPESAGTAPFSEPESAALRDFIASFSPVAVVFWHSQSGTVYAAQCGKTMAKNDLALMRAYADAAGYKTQATFDAYPVAGDSEGWLASIGIPALTVELTTHTDVEWDKNLAGADALLRYFSNATSASTSSTGSGQVNSPQAASGS